MPLVTSESNILLIGHRVHSRICVALVQETNESKSTAAVGVAVLDNDLITIFSVRSGKKVTEWPPNL